MTTFSADDIKVLVEQHVKSSDAWLFLDSSIWNPGNEKKEIQLLQYCCAMANMGGGKIIIGIKTMRQRAQKLDIFPLPSSSAFWLSTLISTSISPIIEDLYVTPVFIENDNGVIVIQINGKHKPYMASDGKYYSLVSTRPRILSENEIRTLYLTQKQPKLEYVGVINTEGIALLANGHPHTINFYPKFIIRNAGNAIEKDYKVEFWFPSSLHDTEFSPLQSYFQRLEGKYSVFSVPGKVSLFQQEIYTIAETKLSVTLENLHDFLTSPFQIQIFYSAGKILNSYSLKDTFYYNHQTLAQEHFKTKPLLK